MAEVSSFYRMENNIKENSTKVINMGKEHTNGHQEIFMLVVSNMMKEKVLALTNGKMEVIIEESGKLIV